jgi:WD40 repeat protein
LWGRSKGNLEDRGRLRPHLGCPQAVTFSRDGRTVVVGGQYGRGGGFVLWRPPGNKFRTGPVGKPVDIYCIALSPDGKTLVTGGRAVTLWDLTKRPKGK